MKWIRVLYSDFSSFAKDQELLISNQNSFDYIEGFVIINRTGLLNTWRSSFDPKDPIRASQFTSDGRTLYCLEMAVYFSPNNEDIMNQVSISRKIYIYILPHNHNLITLQKKKKKPQPDTVSS